MNSRPLVSIGVPLYNSDRYLVEALDSLLAQDYPNLEVIISDNGSTDATESICRAYAARDDRIKYHRTETNYGAVWNFNRVAELANGDFFMWAAHDDNRAPTFVSRCVEAFDARPEAVLCCSEVGFIDETGRPIERWFDVHLPTGKRQRARVREIAHARYWLDFYGLIRRSALAKIRPAQPVWGFDVVIGMELCLLAQMLLVPERLFFYRLYPQKTTQRVASTLGPASGSGPVPVNWSAMTLELARAVWHAPLNAFHRAALIVQLVFELCVFNGLVGLGIRKDVGTNLTAAWNERRIGRFAALVLMAALVFPVQNRLVRGGYRLIRPRKRTSQTPV